MMDTERKPVSKQAFGRLPRYLTLLYGIKQSGGESVSAPMLAAKLGLNEVQVRKDLAAVSATAGKPKKGFEVEGLIADIEACLGYDNISEAVLVGVGHLGRALLAYGGFEAYGLNILMGFDSDPALEGGSVSNKPIFHVSRLVELCRRIKAPIGIIATPAQAAQEVCDCLVDGGVTAIWNFAPVHLNAPEGVLVENEDMALGLARLSSHLSALKNESR